MADFNIKNQHAQVIQQADVINVGALEAWDDVSQRLRMLLPCVTGLVNAGELDRRTAGSLRAAISAAVTASEKKGRLGALLKAKNIATGVSILSGVSQTVAEVMQMMQR